MPHPIEPSILRILNSKGQTIGTGFLVSKTLAVTCAHVAMSASPDGENRIRAQFTGKKQPIIYTKILDEFLDLDRDVAILLLESVPDGVQPLRLGLAAQCQPGNPFYSFGYTSAAKVQGIIARGTIDGYLLQHRLLQLQAPQANHGISGAPVLDEKRGVVVGMITKGHNELGRNQETTFVTPSELFFETCSEIQPDEICPYLGLESFSAETERFFFGRTALTEKLLTIISHGCRFLAVFGPSGSGKSSVVRAGLLPDLKKGQPWAQIIIRPADDPFTQLTAAGLDLSNLPTIKTVLFIDQFEELFTCSDDICKRFVHELAAALDNSRLILIIAMRDDFYSVFNAKAAPLAASPDKVVADIPVTLERADLVAMIEQPAATVGLSLEEGLTDAIIKDAATNGTARSSTLPLLEFAMTQLWDKRCNGLLTHDAYQSIGGVTGCLARWADDAYSDLPKSDQLLAESLLTALVHLGDESLGLPDTRRRRVLAEFDEPTLRVIKHFADRRLLVTSGETVELVHDALVREWGRLRGWIDKDREQLRIIEVVSEAANTWSAAPQNPDLLVHHGGRLDDALKLQNRLSIQERTYLAICKTTEQHRRRNAIAWVSLAVLIVVSVLAGWAYTSNQNAIQLGYQAATANAAKATAIGEANVRATAQANAETQKMEAQKQSLLALASKLAAQAQAIWGRKNSKQQIAVLLAIQSMRIFPIGDAAQVLQNNTLIHPVVQMAPLCGAESIAFSPDGRYLVSGGCYIHIWDAVTGREIIRIDGVNTTRSVAFSPDGKYVVSGISDNTVRLWESATGKAIARMNHTDIVNSVAFSPNGKYIVSGSSDKTARVWEIATGKEVAHFKHDFNVESVAFSPDGRYVVTGSNNNDDSTDVSIRLWDISTNKEIREIHMTDKYVSVNSVAFSPDGKYLVSGCAGSDQTARVWDIATGQEISRMTHDSSVNSVAFSSDGKYVVSGSDDGTARVWEATTGKEIARMTYDNWVKSVAFSPNSQYIAASDNRDTIRIWQISKGPELVRIKHNYSTVKSVALSRDGKYMVSGATDNMVYIWETSTGKEITHMKHNHTVNSVALSSNEEYVASGTDFGEIHIWTVRGQEIAHMTLSNDDVHSVAFSPDGKYLVSGSNDKTVRVWDVATGREVTRITYKYAVDSVAFSRNGKYIVSGSLDTIYVWDINIGQEIAHMSHNYVPISAVAFSPDSKYVVSGDFDGIVHIWDIAMKKELTRMAHDDEVTSVSFSPDGKYVASGSLDNTVRVWDAATGKEIGRMVHDDDVTSISFSPDGRYVASGSRDNTARVWFYLPQDLIENACLRIARNLTDTEWSQYIGNALPYQAVCPNLPIEPEPTVSSTATPAP